MKTNRRHLANYIRTLIMLIFVAMSPQIGFSAHSQERETQQVRTEISYQDGKLILVSDLQERITRTRYRASGNVMIAFKDIVITSDGVEYDEETREGHTTGLTRFSQGQQWLECSRAEFNFTSQTGTFYDARGFTDRQFLITGRTVRKTGPDTYRVEEGTATTCLENQPKWSFKTSSANIRIDSIARLRKTVFKIKGIPVFYAPYMIFPMEKKTRSSGFIPFRTGNSTSKGRMFSEGYYQTLGTSADVTIYADYFSLRGLALGSIFRARPNPSTRFIIQGYGIDDKLKQGGVLLTVDGESRFRDDWRAVARVNVTSNFSFRQAFSDSFRAATISQEHALAFLTRNHNSFSTNIAYRRDEVFFPKKSLVVRKIPSLEFLSLGTALGNSPFLFSLRTSMDGLSRADSLMETQRLVQRLDVYPRLSVRLPSFKGFSLMPSIGFRETYYGAQMSTESPAGTINRGLHRYYTDLSIELRPPVLERDFTSSRLGEFHHEIEPFILYRRIHGIKDLDKIVRFDEQDAIADTNEIEYGIINRFFSKPKSNSEIQGRRELLSLALVQKYYFDPTFGGAFHAGQVNAFYPLDTVTGLYQTGAMRNLSPVSAIIQLFPKDGIHHDLRADFDAKLQRWRNGSLATIWQQGKFFLSGTYFRNIPLETMGPARNHIQGQIGYGSTGRGLSSSMTISYNLRTSQLLNSQTRINYIWDCCGIAVEFNQFDLGLRTESRFSFSFTLKGIGSFGNLKRPDSLF